MKSSESLGFPMTSEGIRGNPLNANPTKWSNTLKQFVRNLPTNCLSVFDHFVELAFKGLISLNSLDVRSQIWWRL